MLAGQVRPEEEAGGVAAKPASDHEGEKAEAVAGARANTGKKNLAAIQRTNRDDFVALALQKEEVVCFYSTEGETRLSSFCGNYPFWGTDIELGTTLGFLEGHLSKTFFKTREHFFQFCKCIHVSSGEGVHSGAAAATAIKLLRGTALEAKRATNKGSIKGLDVAAWNEVKGEVMAVAALQQARGCSVFGAFLDGTGDALLAETNSFDSWWGLGMGMAQAVQTPKEARTIAWGRPSLFFRRRPAKPPVPHRSGPALASRGPALSLTGAALRSTRAADLGAASRVIGRRLPGAALRSTRAAGFGPASRVNGRRLAPNFWL